MTFALGPTVLAGSGVALLGLAACGSIARSEKGAPPMLTPSPSATSPAARVLTIELLALDLSTCGRCTGTSANLDEALGLASARLREAGIATQVRRTIVASEEQAVRLRFLSSPTIRVDGRDVALELRESDCGDCADLCGSDGGVGCRVWVWEGREYVEAPVPLLVDAVLEAATKPAAPAAPTGPFRLPENLHGFFRERAKSGKGSTAGCCGSIPEKPCCPSAGR
jgi:hypothetical protein